MSAADELRLGLDPSAFARALGLEPDPWQEQMLGTTAPQIIVNCSRQVGKSTAASVKAVHRVTYFPGSLVLLVSPTQRQSGELFRKVVEMLHRLKPGPALIEENKLSLQLEDGGRIVSLPGSADTVRGYSGASLVIEDEAAFVRDDLNAAIRPMLATTRGQLVLMSTPFGKRGHFFDAWTNGGAAWDRVSIKATDCPRITPEFLASERAALGEWRFRQEYLCEFVESADQFFSYGDVEGAFSTDVLPLFGAEPGGPPSSGSGIELLFGGVL